MRRGRRRDEYPYGEFRASVLDQLAVRGLGLRSLELLSGVNRGTLSGVLHGKRPCGREDRLSIMNALGFGADIQARFLPEGLIIPAGHDRILLDGSVSAQPGLRRGQEFMSRAQFAEAYREFRAAFDSATVTGDALHQADAASRVGWFYGELEQFDMSRHWTALSIRLIERHLGLRTDEIIESVHPSRRIDESSERAAHILSRSLRFYSKIFAVRLLHHMEMARLRESRQAFEHSLRLDERLQLPELGHGLRWNAVAMSTDDGSQLKDIDNVLSASREYFPIGSPAEASLIRERGIVRWQKDRIAAAAEFLWEAKGRLAVYADARALGPTFCVLSKIMIQDGSNFRQARRYALIAATLHPHGYVLDHSADQLGKIPIAERLRDFDDLLAGAPPFDIVHHVLEQVAQGSPVSASDLIQRNLARVRRALQPSRTTVPAYTSQKP